MRNTAVVEERGYQVVANGLVVTRDLSLNEWQQLGRMLAQVSNRTAWAIGDWLVYGSGRGDYGEYYDFARDITGRAFDSLSQAARVSKAFPIDARVYTVPWSHYREVLRVEGDTRTMALEAAMQNKWTRDDMADFINSRDGALPTVTPNDIKRAAIAAKRTKGWQVWNRNRQHRNIIQCPSCGHKFERRKKKAVHGISVEEG